MFFIVDLVREGMNFWKGSGIVIKFLKVCLFLGIFSLWGMLRRGSVVNDGDFEEVVSKVERFL